MMSVIHASARHVPMISADTTTAAAAASPATTAKKISMPKA